MFDPVRRIVEIAFGEGVLADADPDDLFEISTGYVTLGANGYGSLDQAALAFGNVDASDFDAAVEEIEDLMSVSQSITTKRQEIHEDDYGYTWVVLENSDFDELVTAIHGAADTLIESGFGDYLLCAVFAFSGDKEIYLLYNFKRGKWYPFVPVRQGVRDSETEEEIRELMDGELDLETEKNREYAFWDIPF